MCEEHGRQRWQGDIVCTACGLVYPAGPELMVLPDFCSCKARLLPHDKDRTIKWSGKGACPECARQGR